MNSNSLTNDFQGVEIAIIGMGGRFPLSKNLDIFWQNLKNGYDGIRRFSDEELISSGVNKEILRNEKYVKTKGIIDDIELFDAHFFNYTPKDAESMDPQHRLFLECAWEALENAGYDSDRFDGTIGVFAGVGFNNYLLQNIYANPEYLSTIDKFELNIGNHNDFLSTRVSYKLNLKGPSFTMQTACSTSLVAVHVACQSLLNRDCDLVLTGGVRILSYPHISGYLSGGVISADGCCRAFDAEANGFVPGEGVGIIVLKRLEDALNDGDYIHAIIRGSAINNDGSEKIGFTAPSIEGQTQVIVEAQEMASMDADTITYIETHGTGTELGDPIEIKALTQAFRVNTDKKGFCAIGSVKTNIGHLDSAAGIVAIIKTILALKNKQIPPSLHFANPNPKIDFENSPFYVNTKLSEWCTNGFPRRAGVSSFGIGGTNAHVILEEAPNLDDSSESRIWKIISFSAKTESALNKMTVNLVDYLKENQTSNIADIAYTFQVGRKAFQHRRICVCSNVAEAINILSTLDPRKVQTTFCKKSKGAVTFMFPGQGSQYINMGLELYHNEPFFREQMDRCFAILAPILDCELKCSIYPDGEFRVGSSQEKINRTQYAQPLIFIIEYNLAKLLIKWGIKPDVMIGHSIGEYVAACLAGVFSLRDALKLVVIRGQMMQELTSGAMMSVPLSEAELLPLLSKDICLAAVNGPSRCVLSGTYKSIDAFSELLKEKGYESRLLQTSHAFHSYMMDPVLAKFESEVDKIKLNEPQLPYLSNVTGDWITIEEATDPGYWSKHLRNTVRFNDGISKIISDKNQIFIEVGPGTVLSTFVRQHSEKKQGQVVLNSLRHPNEDVSDTFYLMDKVAKLWLYGREIDWLSFYEGEKRHRLPLPTYPFQRQRYWVDAQADSMDSSIRQGEPEKKTDMSDWFYMPTWEQSVGDVYKHDEKIELTKWLIFVDKIGLADRLADRLRENGQHVSLVRKGVDFCKNDNSDYTINPCKDENYNLLLEELKRSKNIPGKILHLWSVTKNNINGLQLEDIDKTQEMGLHSLLNIVRAIAKNRISSTIELEVISNNIYSVTGDENLSPVKATILGAIKIIPLEYTNVHCRLFDIVFPETNTKHEKRLFEQLYNGIRSQSSDIEIAFRGIHSWKKVFKPIRLDKSADSAKPIKKNGVYLITGGFGGIGFTFATHLAQEYKARLVLVGRSTLPERNQWNTWLETHDKEDSTSQKIKKVRELESVGAKVLAFSANVADYQQMAQTITKTRQEFGQINGVLHTAGVADYAGIIQKRSRGITDEIMSPKVMGTIVLDNLLNNCQLDFFVCFSSLGNFIYKIKFGQIAYNAANEFLDAFSHYKNSCGNMNLKTINWTDWLEAGITIEAIKHRRKGEKNIDYQSILNEAIVPAEGIEIFYRIMVSTLPQIAVSTYDLNKFIKLKNIQIKEKTRVPEIQYKQGTANNLKPRPELSISYLTPANEIEKKVAFIFQNFLGYDAVGIIDDFFELGGDSLKAMNLLAIIQREFNVEITLAEFFYKPTIESVCKLISATILANDKGSDVGENYEEVII